MKKIFLLLLITSCGKSYITENSCIANSTDSYDYCVLMCNSKDQDYSRVQQYSSGICLCDNTEGKKAQEAYEKHINDQGEKDSEGDEED